MTEALAGEEVRCPRCGRLIGKRSAVDARLLEVVIAGRLIVRADRAELPCRGRECRAVYIWRESCLTSSSPKRF